MIDRSFFLRCQLTVGEAGSQLALELISAGIQNAQLEARQLLIEAAGLTREDIILRPKLLLGQQQKVNILQWLEQRACGVPLARIRGWQEFYGRRFKICPATLEPRSDSEILIDTSLKLMTARKHKSYPWRIIDVGTGTGCLALTLLAELPNATATGIDICDEALDTARRNAMNLGLEERTIWLNSNYLEQINHTFDLLISNPPYIKSSDIQTLQVEVLQHDPHAALDGGMDGLAAYRNIAEDLLRVIPQGFAVLETACNDAARVVGSVMERRDSDQIKLVGVWPDLSGCERCVAFQTIS